MVPAARAPSRARRAASARRTRRRCRSGPGPLVRFGINPRAVTGQIGPTPAPAVPEDAARHLAKLGELRRPGAPFPLRLTRFFWRDGEAGFRSSWR